MAVRESYLAALGLVDWQQRQPLAVAAATVEPVVQAVAVGSAAEPTPAIASTIQPATQPSDVADTWDTVAAQVAGCVACGLHQCRTRTVFGVGDRQANWLVVGEAPGAEEDKQGEPFVGRAGGLLNSMLRGIGLEREQVFIANVLKCRPPNNRDPQADEVAHCLPYLERQIALLKPRIMLAVGRIAAQNLLATDTPIGKLRGHVHAFGNARIPLVVTYHPAYLLRSPTEKRKAWEDLKFARRVASGKTA